MENHNYILPCTQDTLQLNIDVMVVSLHGSGPLLAVVRELEKGSKACFDSIPNITFYESNNSMRFGSNNPNQSCLHSYLYSLVIKYPPSG